MMAYRLRDFSEGNWTKNYEKDPVLFETMHIADDRFVWDDPFAEMLRNFVRFYSDPKTNLIKTSDLDRNMYSMLDDGIIRYRLSKTRRYDQ